MTLWILAHVVAVIGVSILLALFSYVDRVYRELGKVTSGRIRENLEVFEADVEPRLRLERSDAATSFALLSQLFLVLVSIAIAGGVAAFVPRAPRAIGELLFFVILEILVVNQFVPHLLLTRTDGRWMRPLAPVVRVFVWMVVPVRLVLQFCVSLAHLTDEQITPEQQQQESIEAMVEVAKEEGILEHEDARLIESVVEFGDKTVREVMTPRDDIVALPAETTVEQLTRTVLEKKFSRIPIYRKNLDDIEGIVSARDILQVRDSEAPHMSVVGWIRPVLFVPETKPVSELLKELQKQKQQIAMVVDEYGSIAGLVTYEDLFEEIVGEIVDEEQPLAADVIREDENSFVLKGSVPIGRLSGLLGTEISSEDCSTVAGLINRLLGHVPKAGESVEHEGLRLEVLEANQQKVLKLRVRRLPQPAVRRGARAR
jgi:CBS domain containing-hemolysin-like protein